MTKINPYEIVKRASLFDQDGYLSNSDVKIHYTDTIAPLIGMLIGGGYGAYTGKSLGGKLLKGLTGAGIGGMAGMGVNHMLDRTLNSNYMNRIYDYTRNLYSQLEQQTQAAIDQTNETQKLKQQLDSLRKYNN